MSLETVCKKQDESVLEILGGCLGRVLCLKVVLVSPNMCSLLCAGILDVDHPLPVACPLCQRLVLTVAVLHLPFEYDNEAE